jgi:FKBP-type peptidyl-prolyl cis-trans isomerase
MLKPTRVLLVCACAMLAVACKNPAADKSDSNTKSPADLQTDAQKFGYSVGYEIGKNLAQVKDDVDVASVEAGISEAVAGKTARLTDKEMQDIKTSVGREIQQKQMAARAAAAQKAKDDGAKFLADNGKRPEVKTTASGLQYEVTTEGKGDHPTLKDKVTVNYKGTLTDGTVFDSSYDRGQPATLPVGGVIPGWTEGLQLMSPGSKYKFYIPSNLAYGERGAGQKIPPNSTLVFEVELLSVEAAPATPAPAAPATGKPLPPTTTIKPVPPASSGTAGK